MDSDRIIVLDAGRVVEFDTPATLIAKGVGGQFYGLVKEAGLLEDAAKAADNSSITTAATSSATATATPAPPGGTTSGGADAGANAGATGTAKDGEEGRR
ncbi:hypothetical protein ABW21_db0206704 [Orbilia brochopaga]|nr:hypothetical protein ABW21_db0206704 [Drechslerella brochopaga]